MEGYFVGLNLNRIKKITKQGIVERITSATFIFMHPHIYFGESIKLFLLENSFNGRSINLIYAVICQKYEEGYIGETCCPVKKRIDTYTKHIKQPQYQQFTVEEYLSTCGDGKFHMFPFFKILRENKSEKKLTRIIS